MKKLRQLFQRPRRAMRNLNRGSILVLTLFIVTSLTLAIGTLSQWTLNEMKVNEQAIVKLQANNAAEAASEYAMASLKQRWDNQASFPSNQFVNNPVTIPANISSYLWANTDVNGSSVVVKTGLVPYAQPIYIDPNDPANVFDPQRGKIVNACDVYVYTAATATLMMGRDQISQTGYACQALEVRDAPLFSHAIFYNMDLEFHPGPNMTITGPVHANGNIWAVAQSALTFSGPITTSGNFNVGLVPWPTNWSNTSESAQTGNVIYIPTGNGSYASPYKGSGSQQSSSSYWDSRTTNFSGTPYTNWRDFSANRWGGNLQTSANGVPEEKLTGYDDYVYHVNGTSQDLNYAYAMIEPNEFNPATNAFHKGVGETDKFERKAGLIVKVHALGTVNITQSVTLSGNYAGNSSTNTTAISSNIDPLINTTVANWLTSSNGNLTLAANQSASGSYVVSNGSTLYVSGNVAKPTSNTTAFLVLTQVTNSNSSTKIAPSLATNSSINATLMEQNTSVTHNVSYNSTTHNTTANITRTIGFAYVEFETLKTTVDGTTGVRTPVYDNSTALSDSNGDVIYPGDVVPVPIAVNSTQITGTYNATTGAVTNGIVQDLIKVSPAISNPGNGTDMWGGLYDGRRASSISTVNLDVGELKSLVDDNVSGQSANAAAVFTDGSSQTYVPSNQYNGVVYAEFPQLPGNTSRLNSVTAGNITYNGDKVTDSVPNMGIMLTDATSNSTSTGVPNPSYNDPSVSGHAGRQLGFTVATNNCMYVKGNFNADGNISTPMSDTTANQQINDTMPDSGNMSRPDPSCALAADSVTCLSNAWVSRNSHASSPNTATATEVNAAILCGIVPSDPNNSAVRSGGSHNFPRFLENWSGIVFRYRGSMVDLFESELADQPYGSGYYSPPNREWGFYQGFANGVYPPGTPNARTYYRVGFQILTKAQFDSMTAGL